MRVAILETVKTTGGFEQEFDRLIIDELKRQGHTPELYLPENSSLPVDFCVPIKYMSGGRSIDYEGAGKIKKIWMSLQREIRRIKWFDAAYERAIKGEIDTIIITTATYRYLRSLSKSKLRTSPIPIVFIFLGVNPQEKPKFIEQARKFIKYPNIRLKVTSLRNDFKCENIPNVEIIKPPVLVPPRLEVNKHLSYNEPIKIGFFGHYRKGEKDIAGIVDCFLAANVEGKAELLVQAAPNEERDAEDLNLIMVKYNNSNSIKFISGKFSGNEWYGLLQSVHVIFLPYTASRYLYNWSAVYFNALGLFKPVLVTDVLNPEIIDKYRVGSIVDLSDKKKFTHQLQMFINNYKKNLPSYEEALLDVNKKFSAELFINNILK